jgi:hypothetical protein
VTGGLRKLPNEELHNLSSSPSILGMMQSRRVRLAAHVALMGECIQVVGGNARRKENTRKT